MCPAMETGELPTLPRVNTPPTWESMTSPKSKMDYFSTLHNEEAEGVLKNFSDHESQCVRKEFLNSYWSHGLFSKLTIFEVFCFSLIHPSLLLVWPQVKKIFHILVWIRKDWKPRYLYWHRLAPFPLQWLRTKLYSQLSFPLALHVSVPVGCFRSYKCWSLKWSFSLVSSKDMLSFSRMPESVMNPLAFVIGGNYQHKN